MDSVPFSTEDPEDERVKKHIFENGQGVIKILNSAPTASVKLLEPSEIGRNGTILYFNIDGTMYSVNLTTVA